METTYMATAIENIRAGDVIIINPPVDMESEALTEARLCHAENNERPSGIALHDTPKGNVVLYVKFGRIITEAN
jgi:hypothetical protein